MKGRALETMEYITCSLGWAWGGGGGDDIVLCNKTNVLQSLILAIINTNSHPYPLPPLSTPQTLYPCVVMCKCNCFWITFKYPFCHYQRNWFWESCPLEKRDNSTSFNTTLIPITRAWLETEDKRNGCVGSRMKLILFLLFTFGEIDIAFTILIWRNCCCFHCLPS